MILLPGLLSQGTAWCKGELWAPDWGGFGWGEHWKGALVPTFLLLISRNHAETSEFH